MEGLGNDDEKPVVKPESVVKAEPVDDRPNVPFRPAPTPKKRKRQRPGRPARECRARAPPIVPVIDGQPRRKRRKKKTLKLPAIAIKPLLRRPKKSKKKRGARVAPRKSVPPPPPPALTPSAPRRKRSRPAKLNSYALNPFDVSDNEELFTLLKRRKKTKRSQRPKPRTSMTIRLRKLGKGKYALA